MHYEITTTHQSDKGREWTQNTELQVIWRISVHRDKSVRLAVSKNKTFAPHFNMQGVFCFKVVVVVVVAAEIVVVVVVLVVVKQ